MFPTLPEEYGHSRQLSKEAEPLLWKPFGNSISPEGLLTATLIQGAKRRLCPRAAALQTPGSLRHREALDEHFGGSQLSLHTPACGNGASCGGNANSTLSLPVSHHLQLWHHFTVSPQEVCVKSLLSWLCSASFLLRHCSQWHCPRICTSCLYNSCHLADLKALGSFRY